jgi:hypothetical protein
MTVDVSDPMSTPTSMVVVTLNTSFVFVRLFSCGAGRKIPLK